MDLVKVVQALRRHLRVVIAAVIIGAALGAAASFLGDENAPVTNTQGRRWQASATVGLTDADAANQTAFGSVSRIAAAATGPDVAARVAKQVPDLGLDAATIQTRLRTTSNPRLRTVRILAVSGNQQRAIALADATATQLVGYVNDETRASIVQQRDDLARQMTTIREQRAALDLGLGDPNVKGTDRDILAAQSESLISQYRVVYDRFTNIASLSTSSIVSPLRPASAKPITLGAYKSSGSSTSSLDGPIPRGLLGALLGLLVGVIAALALALSAD